MNLQTRVRALRNGGHTTAAIAAILNIDVSDVVIINGGSDINLAGALVVHEWAHLEEFTTPAEQSDDDNHALPFAGGQWTPQTIGLYILTVGYESTISDAQVYSSVQPISEAQPLNGTTSRRDPYPRVVGWNATTTAYVTLLGAGELVELKHSSDMTDPPPSYRNITFRVLGL